MANELATVNPAPGGLNVYTPEQVALIKATVCKGTSDDELKLFIQVAQKKGLDPFSKQIHAVKRWDGRLQRDVMSIQTSIDGYRLIAERTGKYGGQRGPFWTKDGKEWLDVWLDKDPPAAAKIGILRKDFLEPLWAVATWEEYKQTTKEGKLSGLWAKMGALMLGKVAEALGLRRAFPEELSGIYTREEMDQADSPAQVVETAVVKPQQATLAVQEVTETVVERGWTLPLQEAFVDRLNDLYLVFKAGGHPEMYQDEADTWQERRRHDQAQTVVSGMEERIAILKGALAKAKAPANPPSGNTTSPKPTPAAGNTSSMRDDEPPEPPPPPDQDAYQSEPAPVKPAPQPSDAFMAACKRFEDEFTKKGVQDPKGQVVAMRDRVLANLKGTLEVDKRDPYLEPFARAYQAMGTKDDRLMVLAQAMESKADQLKVPKGA